MYYNEGPSSQQAHYIKLNLTRIYIWFSQEALTEHQFHNIIWNIGIAAYMQEKNICSYHMRSSHSESSQTIIYLDFYHRHKH
eukprot:snap_masked-scaffold_1-processed-gene-4.40-mRNA-1 protein AED:1.00 eAED:1.00 QI:0/0/0/0/1/1/3/0/81